MESRRRHLAGNQVIDLLGSAIHRYMARPPIHEHSTWTTQSWPITVPAALNTTLGVTSGTWLMRG